MCDDPEYIAHYKHVFAAQLHGTPPTIDFGPGGNEGLDKRRAAASSMPHQFRPIRRTSMEAFMQDLWLMVMSKALIGTSGSTVSDVVRGYRQALNFEDNHVAVYGERPKDFKI